MVKPNITGKTVLVIDDNAPLREALLDVLDTAGLEVLTAANGRDGVLLFAQQRPSIGLVILDMNMPIMNGDEALHHLRQIDPQITVIISSSLEQEEIRQRIGDQLEVHILRKPYHLDMLLQYIEAIFAVKQDQQDE